MAVKWGSRAMTAGSLVYSTGQNSTPGLSATKSYSRALPSAVVVTILLRCVALRGAGDHAALDQVDDAVAQQLGVHAELAVVAQQAEHAVGHRADPGLQRRAVGDALGHQLGDRPVAVAHRRARAARPAA